MPYCTIEEAWSNSLTSEELKPYLNSGAELSLSGVDHEPYTKVPGTSRTYNRLPSHSGPETRLEDMPEVDSDESMFDVVSEGSVGDVGSVYDLEEYKNTKGTNKNITKNLKKLIKENQNLKNLIKKLKKSKETKNDTNKEFILFIFSGLVVIMILENLRKIYRRF